MVYLVYTNLTGTKEREEAKMAKVITVTNHKGGIGKTTTACAVASILRSLEYRVLFIDADWQCNSTDTYRAEVNDVATLYDLLHRTPGVTAESAVQHTEYGDIIPGDQLLSTIEPELQSDPADGVFRLQDALDSIQDDYDYIVMDTNPAASLVLWNCLVATDAAIIPMEAERYGLMGLKMIGDTIKSVQRRHNKHLNVVGVLLINYDARFRIAKQIRPMLSSAAESISISTFNTIIRTCADVGKAQSARLPLIAYAKKSTAAIDYQDFVKELLERINEG